MYVQIRDRSHKSLLSIAVLVCIVVLIGITTAFFFIASNSKKVDALSPSDWDAGRIIDDYVFTNTSTMNTSQIQAFLNSKVPVCDTGGTLPASDKGRSDITRAQYAALQGWHAPPYTCLRNFTEGGKSGAQIIHETAQEFQINPQVLLVLLEKEQSLVQDTWPLNGQYRSATGYACGDTSACEAQYYGFTNQVRWAARMFRAILNASPTWYSPYVVGNNTIYYNPGPCTLTNAQNICIQRNPSACGSTTVNIQNRSTQALYSYTPYQPNPATLNWKLGNGPAVSSAHPDCGAFGNINFFTLFTDWFGRTTLDCRPGEQPYAEVMRLYNRSTYKHFYTVYNCEAQTLAAKHGFKFEGTAFYQTNASSPYAVVVHRLYNPTTFQHLWVTTQAEINSATQFSGYRYEGIGFYAVKPEVPNSVVVHRLYNPVTYKHLWVTTQAEINSATQFSGYRYEGPAFWAAPPPTTP